MRQLIVIFMALAGLGFIVSLIAHLIALAGCLPPGGNAILIMHVGIFIVWPPAVLVAMRLHRASGSQTTVGRQVDGRQMLEGCPVWMRYATHVVMLYAFLNFLLEMRGAPTHRNVSGITPQTLRGFSGHWMVFYGTGFALLYSAFRAPLRLQARRCPSGHPVEDSEQRCPTCGAATLEPPRP